MEYKQIISPRNKSETDKSARCLLIVVALLSILLIGGFYLRMIHLDDENKAQMKIQSDGKLPVKLDLEVKEVEDRDLLKDIKTSFIPAHRDLNCGLVDCSKNTETRHRRDTSTPLNSTSNKTATNLKSYPRRSLLSLYYDYEETPWKLNKRRGGMNQPEDLLDLEHGHPIGEAEEGEIGTDNEPVIKPHSFWRDKLGPTEIRKAQAKMMLQYMDLNVDPCDDFYLFACGNWAQANPIPPDKAGYDTFEMLRESLDSVLKDLLLEPEDNYDFQDALINLSDNNVFDAVSPSEERDTTKTLTSSDDAIIKAKNLFRSCMNYDILQRRGHTPLIQLLDKLGGWPMLNPEWDQTKFDWIEMTAKLRLYNNDILISEWVGPDIKNSDEYIIQLDQTSLGLPTRDYFLSTANIRYLQAYTEYLIRVSVLLGAPIDRAKSDTEDIVNFETDLARITASSEDRRNVSELYQRLTIGELRRTIPQIEWIRYFTLILNRKPDTHEPVVCFALKYFQDLVALLSVTDPRTIANYLLWRFVRHRINNLDDRFQDAKQRFYYVLFGRERSPPRWQNCVAQVNSNMGMAAGSLFVEKYFDEVSKNDTLEMTTEIQQAFKDILTEIEWLDDDTRKLAVEKIDAMRLRIGYPDFILDRKQLAKRYYDITIDPDLYFENTLSILKHLTRTEQGRLGQPVNKTLWNTAPAVVNAYYSRNKNQIMFPAGILQPPFYQRWFPRSLNYGGIGVVIGHEITHGFDDKGRLFDKEGNLQRWWKDEAIDGFHKRAQCLIEQYGRYTVQEVGMQVDGVNTQGENIADNGGIKQAFKAYQKWLSCHGTANETLPGLNATHNQLFFINFAQVWCGAMRPEATRNKLKTAVHSPGRYRVIGTLSNSDDFAREYKCSKGTPMNPHKKCTVW